MASQQTQSAVETNVFGNEEDWGEDGAYYNDQLLNMSKSWEENTPGKMKGGLGKDIKAWRHRQTTARSKPHPMEQRPFKLAPLPTDRETLRVPLRADRHVVVQSFRGKAYVNIREFYRHEVATKWLPGKKGINMSVEDWNALMHAASKIDEAVRRIDGGARDITE